MVLNICSRYQWDFIHISSLCSRTAQAIILISRLLYSCAVYINVALVYINTSYADQSSTMLKLYILYLDSHTISIRQYFANRSFVLACPSIVG